MGEADHAILIEQFDSKEAAAEISPHWRGSTFEVRENTKSGPRGAALFRGVGQRRDRAPLFRLLSAGAGKEMEETHAYSTATADSADGTGDDGRFELRREGATVTSVEGLPPDVE